MGMAISNPTGFYQLIGDKAAPVTDSRAGEQLAYIREMSIKTDQYAGVIKKAALKVTKQSDRYPVAGKNPLADQLKIVARLIAGGLQTRIYLVSMGGFDTHARQTDATDTTPTGAHARLLARLSESFIDVFQDDLGFLQVSDPGDRNDLFGVWKKDQIQCQRRDRSWRSGAGIYIRRGSSVGYRGSKPGLARTANGERQPWRSSMISGRCTVHCSQNGSAMTRLRQWPSFLKTIRYYRLFHETDLAQIPVHTGFKITCLVTGIPVRLIGFHRYLPIAGSHRPEDIFPVDVRHLNGILSLDGPYLSGAVGGIHSDMERRGL